jgi:hypothetical protein
MTGVRPQGVSEIFIYAIAVSLGKPKAYHSLPSSAKVQDAWSYTSTHPNTLVASSSSSSSLGTTALRQSWPPVLLASTGLYPEISFSTLQSPPLVGPLERHLAR